MAEVSRCALSIRKAYDLERYVKVGVHLDGLRGVGVSRWAVIERPSGRQRRSKAEWARIATESLMPGVTVADVARRHGTTRWQVYDWRKKLRMAAFGLMFPRGCNL